MGTSKRHGFLHKKGKVHQNYPDPTHLNLKYASEEAIQAALKDTFRRAEAKADIEAQHGPVKIIFKDGKPVEQK